MTQNASIAPTVQKNDKLNQVAYLHGNQGTPRKHAFSRDDELKQERAWLRSTQFTADGSTLIAQDDANKLHTVILPTDLLDADKQPHELSPYASHSASSSLLSYAAHPGFNLADSSTTWVASSAYSLPIQLRNALDYEYTAHTYPWVHKTTEAYMGANTLLFVDNGVQFAAGSRGRIALFNTDRPGEGPVIDRAPSPHVALSQSLSYRDRGLVMGLAVARDRTLAVGTTNRHVTLFADCGAGEVVTSFSLATPQGMRDDCPGNGVTSLAWSPCQRYMLVAERQSDCVQVFDIRTGGERLAYLSGRNAMSTQRCNVAVMPSTIATELWAGGIDGYVRVWSAIGSREGRQEPDRSLKLSDVPVGDISWHPQAAILATSCGGYIPASHADDSSDNDTDDERGSRTCQRRFQTLGIWTTSQQRTT